MCAVKEKKWKRSEHSHSMLGCLCSLKSRSFSLDAFILESERKKNTCYEEPIGNGTGQSRNHTPPLTAQHRTALHIEMLSDSKLRKITSIRRAIFCVCVAVSILHCGKFLLHIYHLDEEKPRSKHCNYVMVWWWIGFIPIPPTRSNAITTQFVRWLR